jgi:hypothetical protein
MWASVLTDKGSLHRLVDVLDMRSAESPILLEAPHGEALGIQLLELHVVTARGDEAHVEPAALPLGWAH